MTALRGQAATDLQSGVRKVVSIYRKFDVLIVSPPDLAIAMAVGKVMAVVRTTRLDLTGRELVLVSQRWALGRIVLGPMRVLRSVAALRRSSGRHGVDETRRRRFAKRQPRWRSAPFYSWPIARFEPFSEPRLTDVPVGRQGLVLGAKVYGA